MKKLLFFTIIFFFLCIPLNAYASNNFHIKNPEETLQINARHAIVFDRLSKRILYGKKENEICKMASTTKIMTAIVVIENCTNLNEIVHVSKKAAHIGGSRLGLSTNDSITVENLLYGLLMVSGNDASIALAEYISGSIENFAKLMNNKAAFLELKSTHFVTPHGLDQDDHYTTSYELAKITDYALQNKIFSKIVKTHYYTITINNHTKNLHNTNELLGYIEGVYGVKTGFTNGANRCLVSCCKRGNLDIICIVLGCDTKKNRTKDSIELINYVFKNFSCIAIKDLIKNDFKEWALKNYNSIKINKALPYNLELYLDENQIPYTYIAIRNDLIHSIHTDFSIVSTHESPLLSNSIVGNAVVFYDNSILFNIPIQNSNTVERKNILYYLKVFIKSYFNFFIFSY